MRRRAFKLSESVASMAKGSTAVGGSGMMGGAIGAIGAGSGGGVDRDEAEEEAASPACKGLIDNFFCTFSGRFT